MGIGVHHFRSTRINHHYQIKKPQALQRNLKRHPVKKDHVLHFMQKMLDRGHAERTPEESQEKESEYWYLPFFGIYHPKKPVSGRIVFESSAKHGGICLNAVLMKSPDLTNSFWCFTSFP